MTRLQHLQAAALAVVLLVGGEVFLMMPEKYNLRGSDESFAAMIEKRANETLDSFMKTVNQQSLKKEELVSVVERLKDIEGKMLQDPNKDTPKKKDIADLEAKLSSLDGKLKTHEDTSVNDKDIKALEERLSSFEAKMKDKTVTDNDLESLKQRMSSFENELKIHGEGMVKKEDLAKLDGFISSMEDDIQNLDKTAGAASVKEEGANVRAKPPVTKETAAPDRQGKTEMVPPDSKSSEKASQNDVALAPTKKNNPPPSTKALTLSTKDQVLLGTFSPKNAPILGRNRADIANPIRTRVLLLSPKKQRTSLHYRKGPMRYISDEMFQIALDGLEQSPYFENLEPTTVPDHRLMKRSVLEEDEDVVWLVDSRNLAPKTYANYSVDEEVLHAATKTVEYQKTLSKKPSLKVVFMDYRDKTAGRYTNCGPERKALIKLLGEGNVRQVVGRVAVDRHWNDEKQWIDQGTVWNNQDYTCSGARTLYVPYTVRSDYATEVERLFPSYLDASDKNKKGLTPVETVRPLDVAHYWDEKQTKDRPKEYRYHSQLRNTVSGVLSSLNGTMAGTRKIRALAETVSEGDGSKGRTEVFEAYVNSLLTTKIVVVAQRDIWEDHFRLFEAFVGGAMVMTDPMLSLPEGLMHGENIVVYNSRDELKELLLHYLHPEQDEARLEIARKGYEVAMGQHRSFHCMEAVFFGTPLSSSTLSPSESQDNMKKLDSPPTATPPVKDSTPIVSNEDKEQAQDSVSVTYGNTDVLTKKELALLETFNPAHAPILPETSADLKKPARVRVLLMSPKKRKMRTRERQALGGLGLLGDEMINIVLDGLQRSPYFHNLEPTVVMDHKAEPDFVLKEPEDVIWVVDSRNLTLPSYHYSVDEDVLIAAKATVRYQETLKDNRKPSLKVVFVDYHDKLAGRAAMCSPEREALIKLLGVGNVRHVVGKVVTGREWNADKQWTERGTIWENKDYECFGKPTLRAPYSVRSDYVDAVQRLYPKFLSPHAANKKRSETAVVDTVRNLDVAHFWDKQRAEGRQSEYRYYSELRNAVSEVVSSLNGTMAGSRKITALAETVSTGGSTGRTEIADSYVERLLTTKIVVVAQRDRWEDHYRLFEAFTGGAMVMTDQMISLPPGLVDGENVVVYNSLDELRELLLHYLHPAQNRARLGIARKGYEVAMGRHRSFHRMEEIFYGKALSPPMLSANATQDGSKN